MGIFHKTCPECMAQNAVSTKICACGYAFEDGSGAKSKNALESIAEEERLYHDYLVARVSQAQEAAKTARRQAELDPQNHTKAADALLAEQALMTARGELAEQETRLRNAELHIQQKVFHRPKAAAPASRPASGNRNSGSSVVHLARSAERKRVAAKSRTTAPVSQIPTASPQPEAPKMAVPATPKPVRPSTPESSRHNNPQALAQRPAETRGGATTPAAKAPAARTVATSHPGEAFRAAQAARAEKVVAMAQRKASRPQVTHVPAPATSAPVRPAHVAPKPTPTTKECPHCWGMIPLAANKCRCGYEFSGGPDLPGLSLSAADLALFQGLDFGGNGKSG